MDSSLISGEWGDFTFRVAEFNDSDRVVEHLRDNFIPDEPIQQYVGMTDNRRQDFGDKLRGLLKLEDTICLMAFDKATGAVAGVLISIRISKGKEMPVFVPKSPLSRIVRGFLVNLESKVNLFDKFGVNHFADVYMISTGKNFRAKGLGTEMFKRSNELLAAMNYPLVTSLFTNPLSRKIGQRLGMEEISRSYFSEMKDTLVEENLALPHILTCDIDESELYACVMALRLK